MFLNKLLYGSVFCCVEYTPLNCYTLILLKKSKNELKIISQENYKNMETLVSTLKDQNHVFLVVNNSQVVTQNILTIYKEDKNAVKAAFPNINLKEFYYDVLNTKASTLVSICRKVEIQKILDQFSAHEISVIQFSLGNSVFKNLVPFLNDMSINTSNGVFEVKNRAIVGWKKEKKILKTYDINGLRINTDHILPLGGILSYHNGLEIIEKDEIRKILTNSFKQKRIYFLGIRFGLGFLLISLMINFFVFSSYSRKVSVLNDELIVSETYKKKFLNLDETVGMKKLLINNMNKTSNSKVIWYIDRITGSVPNTVLLEQINYQPLSRIIQKDKTVEYMSEIITITGEAYDYNDLINWLSKLENIEWIKEVVVNYAGESLKETIFDLQVHLNT